MNNPRFVELLTREMTGELSVEEQFEFQELLKSNPLFRQEYELFRQYWNRQHTPSNDVPVMLEKVKEKIRSHESESGVFSDFSPSTPTRRKWIYRMLWPAAAVFIISIGTYLFYGRYSSQDQMPSRNWQQKYTARGHKSKLILADGTKVTLNADSRLDFPASFNGKNREVRLTGEAFFDVEKDPAHPFIIHTNKVNIRVLGTEFNVRSYPDDPSMETTLIKGSIEVTFTERPSDRIILKPRDKLIIGNSSFIKTTPVVDSMQVSAKKGLPASTIQPTLQYSLTGLTYYRKDTAIIETSWLDNKIMFQNEEFQSLARRMERWYGVNIHFDNSTVETIRFTGLFQKETIQEALFALKLSEKFGYTISGQDVHIF